MNARVVIVIAMIVVLAIVIACSMVVLPSGGYGEEFTPVPDDVISIVIQ